MKRSIFTPDVILLLLATFFYSSSPMLIAPLVVGFSESLGMDAALAGTMTGIMYLSSLFCRPFFGRLADLKSKSFLMKIGLGIMIASVLLLTVAWDGWTVLAARLINGAGYCMCSISITTWIASLFPRDSIGAGIGFYGMVTAISMAVAPTIAIWISSHFSDRISFLASFLFLMIALILVCLVRKKGEPDRKPAAARQGLISWKALPFAGIIMCFTIPFYATTAFLVEYTAARGWSASPSLYFMIYSAALLLMRMLLKDQFDKRPFRLFYWSSLVIGLLSCLLLNQGDNSWIYAIAGICMAGGYGIMVSECQSSSILIETPERSGLASSTFYIGIDLGLLLGPVLGGELIENLGIAWFYPVLALITLLSVLIYMPEHRQIGSVH